MKVKVLKTFGYKKCLYTTDQVLNITKAEEEYINSSKAGLLVEVIEEPEEETNLNRMTKKELLAYAESKGIKLDGRLNKSQMISELEV
jgi:hypothetical protein